MPNTAEAGRALLGVLNDDELERYAEIASDQAALELQRWWWQLALAIGSACALAWGINKMIITTWEQVAWRQVFSALGLALLMGYWPYRRVRNWSLWKRRLKAVGDERRRRAGED